MRRASGVRSAPWTWQEVNGTDKLEAVVDGDGSVKMFSITPYAPIIEFLPAPASLNAGWILPAAGLALLIMLIAATRLADLRAGSQALQACVANSAAGRCSSTGRPGPRVALHPPDARLAGHLHAHQQGSDRP